MSLHDAVENLWFKGAARVGVLISTVVVGPLVVIIMAQTYQKLDTLDHNQVKLESAIDRIGITADNDRLNNNDRISNLNTRINDVQRDYARLNDVKAGFELRDQHLINLDNRVNALEAGRGKDHP